MKLVERDQFEGDLREKIKFSFNKTDFRGRKLA